MDTIKFVVFIFVVAFVCDYFGPEQETHRKQVETACALLEINPEASRYFYLSPSSFGVVEIDLQKECK